MAQQGMLIVIEGTDGSGKSTQFKLLVEALTRAGHEVATFKFPRYDEPSSYFVREYLSGAYGSGAEVGPYTGSLFYALDRYAGAPQIRAALAEGKIVLLDRYVGSNMAHQGTKFYHVEERRGYFIWLDNLEFEMLKIPRPDLNIVLRMPVGVSAGLLRDHGKELDIHELDLDYLERTGQVYDDLCQLFPRDFARIDCMRDGELLDIDMVHRLIMGKLEPLLPAPLHEPGSQTTVFDLPESTAATTRAAEAVSTISSVSEPVSEPVPQKTAKASNASDPSAKASPSTRQAATASENSREIATSADEAASLLVRKTKRGNYDITEAGAAFLREVVSSVDGDVYAFSEKLSPMTVAAAMARLSRRGDDMRVTILDEFAEKMGKDKQLLARVITAYGDDSVQQLAGLHFVVENASNLLTKKLEWGRLAAYLEQSTRYIYFDKKDEQGKYRYHTPAHFSPQLQATYAASMDKIFDLYAELVRKLTAHVRAQSSVPASEQDGAWRAATKAQACDAARPVLPVATRSTVGIFASGQALESLIMHLLSDQLPEARRTGKRLLKEARKVMPTFLERADKPDRGGAQIAYRANTFAAVQKLAEEHLPEYHAAVSDAPVQLTDIWPRNELDLVPDMLYEHSSLPLEAIRAEVTGWPYEQKLTVFSAYMGERLNRRHRPGRALEKAHYSWDLLCDYGIFRDLQRHRMVDDLEWQQLTPRYGYEIPQLVEDAGLSDLFEQCFDISLELFSVLQQEGFALEAQYATLLGHRMRWKVTYNAREAFHLHELRTSPQGHPGYRKLVLAMHETLAEKHPLLAEAMRFVNQGEDPELARLAAERHAQFKLAQLDAQAQRQSQAKR